MHKEKSSGAVDHQRLSNAVEELVEALQESSAASLERFEQVEALASVRMSRWHAAREELAAVLQRISEVEAEREELPNRAYRATLDERFDEEERLKARYRSTGPELEALRERAGDLERELDALCGPNKALPTAGGHETDVVIFQNRRVLDVYMEEEKPLASAKQRIEAAFADSYGPLSSRAHALGQELQGLGEQRRHDPAVKAHRQAQEQARRRAVRRVG